MFTGDRAELNRCNTGPTNGLLATCGPDPHWESTRPGPTTGPPAVRLHPRDLHSCGPPPVGLHSCGPPPVASFCAGPPSRCSHLHAHVAEDVLSDRSLQEGGQHLQRMQEGVRLVIVVPAPVAAAEGGTEGEAGTGGRSPWAGQVRAPRCGPSALLGTPPCTPLRPPPCSRVLLSPYFQLWAQPVPGSLLFGDFDAYKDRGGANVSTHTWEGTHTC